MSTKIQPPTIAIVSAGAMGSGVAARLHSHGCRVLALLEGRSESTKQRAKEAGMENSSLAGIINDADWVFSIMPPGEAEDFIRAFLATYRNITLDSDAQTDFKRRLVFVDCNAKNPQTARRYASLFAGTPIVFIDACIIGWPPKDNHDPTFYASAAPKDVAVLDSFTTLTAYGMVINTLKGEGTGIGDASAMKMSFSGIMKGMVGLYTMTILSSHAHSPVVSKALLHELSISSPDDVRKISRYVPDSFPKAFRFLKEMEEMANFVSENVDDRQIGSDNGSHGPDLSMSRGVQQTYRGFAAVFQRVASSVDGTGDREDLETLRVFTESASMMLTEG